MAKMSEQPGSMEERGDDLLREVAQYDVRSVQARVDRFRKAHSKWKAAQARKVVAEAAERQAQENAGTVDAVQDDTLDALAAALPADGFPRTNPFAPFKAPAPSRLKVLGAAAEARAGVALAKKVLAHQQAGAGSKAAAKALLRTAHAVLSAAAKLPDAKAKTSALRKNRDELVPEWSKAWHLLKYACQVVEEDGGEALHTKLFARKGGNHAPSAPPAPPAAPKPAELPPAQ